MNNYSGKDLFQLQNELVQMKVNIAVNQSIDRVVEQITSLRHEMHDLRYEMNNRFSSLDNRVIAIETRLGIVNARRKGWYDRSMDYLFKTGWLLLSFIFAYVMVHLK